MNRQEERTASGGKAAPEEKIRLLLVDDHTLFREGLSRLLEAESGLELVGHFSSAAEALASSELPRAHVVLLDFDLGETRGLHFIRASRNVGFAGRILMVTAGMSDEDARQALQTGAAGIFLKHNPPTSLVAAIHKVAAGEPWPDARNAGHPPAAATVKSAPVAMLGKREQAVLKGVFEGLANKEIAALLDISESSVKAVLQQLFAKTGVRTRSQLVRVALERHIAYGEALDSEKPSPKSPLPHSSPKPAQAPTGPDQ